MTDIEYSEKMAKKYKPFDKNTLMIESKLSKLDVTEEGKIQGVVPLRGKEKMGHANSGFKRIENLNLIVAPRGRNTIIVLDEA